jgi:hypothetical protein
MAFDYGSIDLGLRNPFKTEGKVTAIRGVIQTLLAIGLLVMAASSVKEDAVKGWTLMIFGAALLTVGIRAAFSGIYATLRYFVGRNHPTSLSVNYSKSQSSSAAVEKSIVAYNDNHLEEMLVGRKNMTFIEPVGLLARLLHSIVPNLLYMPYPIRNLAQRLFAAWVETLTMLLAYGLTAFISLAGFAGELGEKAFPIYSFVLMFYLIRVWHRASKPLDRNAERVVQTKAESSLPKIIILSIFFPIIVGLGLGWIIKNTELSMAHLEQLQASIPSFSPGLVISGLLLFAVLASALIVMMLKFRLKHCDPKAEVSELRENWQESVHPNEIFINLDNLVMANRRYKEVPNRVYRELDPKLNEQVNGKGDFRGEMIQEVQPRVRAMDLGPLFEKLRFIALVTGNLLLLAATAITLILAFDAVDIAHLFSGLNEKELANSLRSGASHPFLESAVSVISLFIWGMLFRIFGNMLANTVHVLYAEIQFESLLVYFKCEGTFSESKISTGTSIHDSTRSENVLVRSSITPWVITSKVVSTTFAATGMKNLEHPRYILEMHKAEDELQAIRNDVIAFLKDRESIAAITSERDLSNTSQIYQINQQTRAMPTQQSLAKDEQAAGYLQQEDNLAEQSSDASSNETDKV